MPARPVGLIASGLDPAQITAELPRLTHAERRELMRQLLALEEDAPNLAECDRRADANFQMLDALEAEDHARRAPQNALSS